MRRIPILTTAAAVALVPAVFGLSGNPALSHSVPVRVPANVAPVTVAQLGPVVDDSSHAEDRAPGTGAAVRTPEPGDDRGGAAVRTPEPGDDRRGTAVRTPEPGDDRGGAAVRTPEPGDDRRGAAVVRTPEPGDDKGGAGGSSDDRGKHGRG